MKYKADKYYSVNLKETILVTLIKMIANNQVKTLMCNLLVLVTVFHISSSESERKLINDIIIYSEQKVFS